MRPRRTWVTRAPVAASTRRPARVPDGNRAGATRRPRGRRSCRVNAYDDPVVARSPHPTSGCHGEWRLLPRTDLGRHLRASAPRQGPGPLQRVASSSDSSRERRVARLKSTRDSVSASRHREPECGTRNGPGRKTEDPRTDERLTFKTMRARRGRSLRARAPPLLLRVSPAPADRHSGHRRLRRREAILEWVPSQKGLRVEAPHRHNAKGRFAISYGCPSSRRASRLRHPPGRTRSADLDCRHRTPRWTAVPAGLVRP